MKKALKTAVLSAVASLLTIVLFIESAHARTEIIFQTGYSYGFCDGRFAYFCMKDLKDRAQDDARKDAEFQCWTRQGKLDSNPFPFCNDYCNPSFLPADAPSTYISCRASCQFDCIIPDAPAPSQSNLVPANN